MSGLVAATTAVLGAETSCLTCLALILVVLVLELFSAVETVAPWRLCTDCVPRFYYQGAAQSNQLQGRVRCF